MVKSSPSIPTKIQKIFIVCAALFVLSQTGYQVFMVLRWVGIGNGGLATLAMAGTYLFLSCGLFLIPYSVISSKERTYRAFLATVIALSTGLLITTMDSILTPFIYNLAFQDGDISSNYPYLIEMSKVLVYLALYSLVIIRFRKLINS